MLKQDINLVNDWMFFFLNIPFFASHRQLHTMEYPYVQIGELISGRVEGGPAGDRVPRCLASR